MTYTLFTPEREEESFMGSATVHVAAVEAPVPAPAGLGLGLVALAGFAVARRRRS